MESDLETATFAGGCFWCTEAIFQRVKGVSDVKSGYSGGEGPAPSYEEVSTGSTGHAESVQFLFDPSIISYRDLLEIFFYTHDPTTLNRQGNDIGPQYRSAVFYHNEEQKAEVEKYIKELNDSDKYKDPIVTEIIESKEFHKAEDYHKEYYERNRNAPYCRAVIEPKLQKFFEKYGNK